MRVMVIAPHPDDEIIGCGGTMAKRIKNGDKVAVCVVTEGKCPMYSKKFIKNERLEMKKAHCRIGIEETINLKMPSAMLDAAFMYQLNDALIELVDRIQPEEVYIPHSGDIHLDHQIVARAAMVATRPNRQHKVKRIYSYEVLSETDWNEPAYAFCPNVYEDITEYIGMKLYGLAAYKSQLQEPPSTRSGKAVVSLAAHRGAVVGVEYAEAFCLMREVK